MRSHLKKCLSIAAIFIFAVAVWASTRTYSTPYDTTQPVEIGQTQLKPGHYTIKANDSNDQISVLQDGKVVATVPCHWVKLQQKADYSEVLSNKDHVTRVEFKGQREAVSVG